MSNIITASFTNNGTEESQIVMGEREGERESEKDKYRERKRAIEKQR